MSARLSELAEPDCHRFNRYAEPQGTGIGSALDDCGPRFATAGLRGGDERNEDDEEEGQPSISLYEGVAALASISAAALWQVYHYHGRDQPISVPGDSGWHALRCPGRGVPRDECEAEVCSALSDSETKATV